MRIEGIFSKHGIVPDEVGEQHFNFPTKKKAKIEECFKKGMVFKNEVRNEDDEASVVDLTDK